MKWQFGIAAAAPRRRWWLLVGLSAALAVGAYAIWDYIEAKRVTAGIVAVARTGAPINPAQLERPDTVADPDRDAAPYYLAAATLASSGTPFASAVLTNERFVAATSAGRIQAAWYATGAVPSTLLEQARFELTRRSDALHLLDEATDRLFTGLAPGTAYSAQIMQLEQLCNLCTVRTSYAAATGDTAAAMRSIRAELGLIADGDRSIVQQPLTPKVMVAAINLSLMLNKLKLDERDLASLSAVLARADDDTTLARSLNNMRAGLISIFLARARYQTRPIGLAGLVPGLPLQRSVVLRPLLAREAERRLETYAALIDASHAPWSERLDRVRAVAIQRQWRDDGGFLARLGWSTEPFGLTAVPLNLASARVARTAIAVERYRLAHHDQLPDSLTETVPAFLPAVPSDPYSGRPIRFVKIDRGYKVYGVSFDRVDDGGDLVRDQPVIRVVR